MPRVELDQRSREASRRLEQIKRLLQPPVRVSHSRFLRLVYVLSLGTAPRRNEAIAGASAAQDHSRSEPQGSRPPPEPDASVLRGLTAAAMADPMCEADKSTLRLNFCRVGEARRARRGARLATQELSRQA